MAAALCAASVAVLLASVGNVGFTRDEGYYFRAADLYRGWVQGAASNLWHGRPGDSLRDDVIVRAWGYNAEHPVLMKTLFGLSWEVFHEKLGWVRDSTAYRLPAMVLAGVMVALVYLFGAEAYSRRIGLVAAALLGTIPRLFHDAHLACFDVPMAALQLLVAYSYWRGLRSAAWAVATGIVFGLALATKLNAFFIPAFLVAHAAVRALRTAPSADRGAPPGWAPLAAMAGLGPVVFLAHWPYLWHDTLARFAGYVSFHAHHEHYPVEYFGQVLWQPPFPWSFVFVMTAVTVPLPSLALMVIAAVRATVQEIALAGGTAMAGDGEASDPRQTRLLLLMCGLGPMLVMTLPGVPVFGGVKHWFTAMPPLAILAAVELDRLMAWPTRWRPPSPRVAGLLYAGVALAVVVPGALGIRLVHPYGIGFYNELIGSVRGAAQHGMLRNFWGYTSRGNLDTLDREAEPGAGVYFHDTNRESFEIYRREGRLRSDLRYSSSLDGAGWALCDQQRAYSAAEYAVWNDWGATRPRAGVYVDEVPMNLLYQRPAREN